MKAVWVMFESNTDSNGDTDEYIISVFDTMDKAVRFKELADRSDADAGRTELKHRYERWEVE